MAGLQTTADWLTAEQAAAELQVNKETVLRWCRSNQLAHTRVGRTYRIPRSALAASPNGGPARARAAEAETRATSPRVIALTNHKGGVGKTTTVVNLGAALAETGRRVLLVDLDMQANATLATTGRDEVTPALAEVLQEQATPAQVIMPTSQPGMWLLPSSIALANVEIGLAAALGREMVLRPVIEAGGQGYDVVLLDCPPSLGLLTVAGLMAATEVIVPVRPQLFSAAGLGQLFDTIGKVRGKLGHQRLRVTGILVNQSVLNREGEPRAATFRKVIAALADAYGAEMLFQTTIPDAVAIEQAHQSSVSVQQWQPHGPLADAYRRLAEEVIARG